MLNLNRKRYFTLLYLLVLALAIILGLVAFLIELPGQWSDYLASISSDLVAVSILFFLVERFFAPEEENISFKVDTLLEKVESQGRISAEKFFEIADNASIRSLILSSKRIDLSGLILNSTINENFNELLEALRNGAQINIVITNLETAMLGATRRTRKLTNEDKKVRKDNKAKYELVRSSLKKLLEQAKVFNCEGKLTIKETDMLVSSRVLRFDPDTRDGKTIVKLYMNGLPEKLSFTLSQKDDFQWHEYYNLQFDKYWENSVVWSPE